VERILFALLWASLVIPFARPQQFVEAEGFGFTAPLATGEALRHSLEKGLQVCIFEEKKLACSPLLKDLLISSRFGLIEDYEVVSLDQESENHLWRAQVKARICAQACSRWSRMCRLLEEKGMPSVMFCLRESLEGELLPVPVAEYQLMQRFEDMGFKVIERDWSGRTREMHRLLPDANKLPEISEAARLCQADFLIAGMMWGEFAANFPHAQVLRHDYRVFLRILPTEPERLASSLDWSFSQCLDSMLYSRENAGKAGLAEIISPPRPENLAEEIVALWLADNRISLQESAEKFGRSE
jgi:hypothetical protein